VVWPVKRRGKRLDIEVMQELFQSGGKKVGKKAENGRLGKLGIPARGMTARDIMQSASITQVARR
jgi:hypothetical protein